MEVVKEQTLFLDTSFASGDSPSEKTIIIPPNYLECGDEQQLRISLMSFSYYCNTPNITGDNNELRIIDAFNGTITDITIPTGCYSACDIKSFFEVVYPDMTMAFNRPINGWVISFKREHTIEFLNKSYEVFGFLKTDNTAFKKTLTSTQPVDLQPYSSIRIDLDNSVNTMNNMNLTNVDQGGQISQWNSLAAIQMRYEPFEHITITPHHAAKVSLASRNINELKLVARVFDSKGQGVTSMPDYQVCVKVETVEYGSRKLSEIEDALKRLVEFETYRFINSYHL